MKGWQCRCCGKMHDELPMHYGAEGPELWFTIPEKKRKKRVMMNKDVCLIDEKYGFIVGNLEIPVLDSPDHFSWDVWVSLSLPNFFQAHKVWNDPGRESEPPYFGWISTSLPGYPETLHLKSFVHTRAVGCRPRIELEPTDHPLAIEQRDGITLARVQEIAELVLHG
ncbi:MAG: DUF2199 domain-containing protein [Fimbriiglobus sp.]